MAFSGVSEVANSCQSWSFSNWRFWLNIGNALENMLKCSLRSGESHLGTRTRTSPPAVVTPVKNSNSFF